MSAHTVGGPSRTNQTSKDMNGAVRRTLSRQASAILATSLIAARDTPDRMRLESIKIIKGIKGLLISIFKLYLKAFCPCGS
jgi:hypothetical protein